MPRQHRQYKGRKSQDKVKHHPVVQVSKDQGSGDLYIASINGIEFCRLAYGHNQLLVALNAYLKTTLHKEQTVVLMGEGRYTALERERAAEIAKEFLEHHAAGVTAYISNNIGFMFWSMLEAYLNVGGLWAKQDREMQFGLDPAPITAGQIQRIFADLALQYVQRQANATGGRRPDLAKEKAKQDLERAAEVLLQEGRKVTYEEAEDVLGLGTGTLKGIVRRHQLGAYWKELKRSRKPA